MTMSLDRSMEAPAEAVPEAGFEHRVVPLIGNLHRQALTMTRHRADAEDLVQDTLAKAFAGFDSFRADSSIHTWLQRIMVNTHISNRRKTRRRPVHHSAEVTDQHVLAGAAHVGTGLPSAEDQALKGFGDHGVKAAMLALPEQVRITVYYADVEGLRYREIADVMNAPIGTVMSRLHRGRRQLRWLLSEGRHSGPG